MRKPHGVSKRIKACSEYCKHSHGSGNRELRHWWRNWLDRILKGTNPEQEIRHDNFDFKDEDGDQQ